ncbi:MAG: hypothetical protein HQL81_13880, partial [Magnetococcales bacterium]|nr:hypothetical protein [Magnetococcales bacterium]
KFRKKQVTLLMGFVRRLLSSRPHPMAAAVLKAVPVMLKRPAMANTLLKASKS